MCLKPHITSAHPHTSTQIIQPVKQLVMMTNGLTNWHGWSHSAKYRATPTPSSERRMHQCKIERVTLFLANKNKLNEDETLSFVGCLKDIEFRIDERLTLPPDQPRCGFHNELCPEDNSGNVDPTTPYCIGLTVSGFVRYVTATNEENKVIHETHCVHDIHGLNSEI